MCVSVCARVCMYEYKAFSKQNTLRTERLSGAIDWLTSARQKKNTEKKERSFGAIYWLSSPKSTVLPPLASKRCQSLSLSVCVCVCVCVCV
jgi:hypothetical protein